MKRFPIIPIFAATLLVTASLVPRSHAAARDASYQENTVPGNEGVTVINPEEEAGKIRRLVKLALANDASAASHQVLDEEISMVEKNKKLKQNVVTSLLQDDSPDPTLPKVELRKYKDGSIRGLLFVQTDNVRGGKPNTLAWVLDHKREDKEQAGAR